MWFGFLVGLVQLHGCYSIPRICTGFDQFRSVRPTPQPSSLQILFFFLDSYFPSFFFFFVVLFPPKPPPHPLLLRRLIVIISKCYYVIAFNYYIVGEIISIGVAGSVVFIYYLILLKFFFFCLWLDYRGIFIRWSFTFAFFEWFKIYNFFRWVLLFRIDSNMDMVLLNMIFIISEQSPFFIDFQKLNFLRVPKWGFEKKLKNEKINKIKKKQLGYRA